MKHFGEDRKLLKPGQRYTLYHWTRDGNVRLTVNDEPVEFRPRADQPITDLGTLTRP